MAPATDLAPISVGTLLLLDAAFVVALTLCVGPALLATAGLGSLLLRVLPPATVLVLSPAWAGLTFLVVLALCVGLLRAVVPQPDPGIYDLKGPQATAWGVNFVLQRVASLPLWKSGYYAIASLRWLILRALGAKIAFRVRTAMDAEVLDAYLLEIEADTMLAGGTSVSAHLTAGGRLHLARVHLERGVELWAGASVAMGVHVGAQSRIGAHTRVLPHVKIGARTRVGSFCRLGEGCQLGEGAVIGDEVNLGRGVVVEAGARVPNGERVPPGTRVRAPD